MIRDKESMSAQNFVNRMAKNMLEPNVEKPWDEGTLKLWWTEYKSEYFVYSEWNETGPRVNPRTIRNVGVIGVSEVVDLQTDEDTAHEQLYLAANWPVHEERSVKAALQGLMGLQEQGRTRKSRPRLSQLTQDSIHTTRAIQELSNISGIETERIREFGLIKLGAQPRVDETNRQVYIVSELHVNYRYPCIRINADDKSIQILELRYDQKLGLHGCDGKYTSLQIGNKSGWKNIDPVELASLTSFLVEIPQSL